MDSNSLNRFIIPKPAGRGWQAYGSSRLFPGTSTIIYNVSITCRLRGCLEEELEVWESVFELEEFGADEYGGVESVDGGEPVEDVEVLGVFLGPEFSHGSEYDAFGVVGPVLEVVDGSVHAAGVGVVGVDDEVVPAGL